MPNENLKRVLLLRWFVDLSDEGTFIGGDRAHVREWFLSHMDFFAEMQSRISRNDSLGIFFHQLVLYRINETSCWCAQFRVLFLGKPKEQLLRISRRSRLFNGRTCALGSLRYGIIDTWVCCTDPTSENTLERNTSIIVLISSSPWRARKGNRFFA